MKNKILILSSLMLIISINLISSSIYYNVSIKYDYGNFSINSVNVIFSQYDLINSPGNYYLGLRNNNNLDYYLFKVPNTIAYDSWDESGKINGGGIITLNKSEFQIFIPYSERADEMVIADSNKVELAKKDIGYFSKNVVSSQVTKEFKASESKSKTDIFSSNNSNTNNYLMVGIIILIVIIVIVIIFLATKKSERKKKN